MGEGKVKSLLSAQMTVIKKLERENIVIPAAFAYVSHKAAVFYVTGGGIYRKDDYFQYPLKEWNEENIKKGCKQILENCAGLIPDNPIKDLSVSDIRNMFELFCFTKTGTEAISNPAASSGVCCSQKELYSEFNTKITAANRGVLNPSTRINGNINKMNFIHKMDKRRFSVYYDLSNSGENSPYEYLSIYVDENIVTVSVNPENDVIKIFTDDEQIGLGAEYAFIMNSYPEYEIKKRGLRFMEIDGKRTAVDVFEIAGKDETKKLCFDTSEFYGKGFN